MTAAIEPAWPVLAARVAARYAGASRFTRHYMPPKLHRDPVHRALLTLAARECFGEVVELGCGRGQIGLCLLEAGLAGGVLGIDRDTRALAEAAAAASTLPFTTRLQDLTAAAPLPAADTFLLIDVLYQLPRPIQRALLAEVARAARTRIVLRTPDTTRPWRSLVTLGWERSMRRLWPHSGANVAPMPVSDIRALLEREGWRCETAPCWQGTPLANVLVIATRASPQKS